MKKIPTSPAGRMILVERIILASRLISFFGIIPLLPTKRWV